MKLLLGRSLAVLVGLGLLLAALVGWLNERGDEDVSVAALPVPAGPAQIERGAYLARAGNCAGCHTLPGGPPYAGGRAIETPFGTIYASNLTPDRATGLGAWSAAQFRRALHNGRSADGRLLYPAFPYPNYTRVTRADANALYAYLQSLPPEAQPNRPHALRFPFDQQAALAAWRALYFRPADPETETETKTATDADLRHGAEWKRGAYLVEGLGHCNACHAARNALGATVHPLDLAGGLIPVQNWYAPSLRAADEAGVADWPAEEVMRLLGTGVSAHGAVLGPMRDVVRGSTQYLNEADLAAMARYLRSLPPTPPVLRSDPGPAPAVDSPGGKLYAQHCASCHGERGEGAGGLYPALAGSRAATLRTPVNLVHLVLEGGFAPSTAGNPRPFGMPPFATVLSDAEVAQVLSYVRASWGNRAEAVSTLDVNQFRRQR